MNDILCGKFDYLRTYLPDELGETGTLNFDENKDLIQYCPEKDSGENKCNNNLDKITAGFLWLLEQCYSTLTSKDYIENNTNAFFLYIISWFSYKLKQIKGGEFTTINELYNKNVKDSGKYTKFIREAYTIGELKGFMDKRNDLLNINIEDLSKFYDAFKLICSMHGNVSTNTIGDTLSDNANSFIDTYIELNNNHNVEGIARNKILPVLSTDYDNLKNACTKKGANCKDLSFLPEITTKFSAQISGDTSDSSIGNRLFTVLSIFGAIAFFLGISYKYSLFGFRKQFQKQKLREKIKNIKKKMNR
ncbi:PIR protein [Plasmodium yoelii]|uniref:PIR protein n=2 Tax=Plasmodium yoelii TaxID=5861 RepID=A0AAF0AYJ4_PLAYO|nr:PIR protein [Plasmodium yoelii]WBY55197.1 PIR protein [Plasmodium yoelii yoelii]CDU16384.1 YIR protein [Plasmodium yoelii]VTZ73121.1 PIR protein [Plasmodium yoelii]|eukprot:XP_022811508.1 PIR protein [Plasmodium yoelii]